MDIFIVSMLSIFNVSFSVSMNKYICLCLYLKIILKLYQWGMKSLCEIQISVLIKIKNLLIFQENFCFFASIIMGVKKVITLFTNVWHRLQLLHN